MSEIDLKPHLQHVHVLDHKYVYLIQHMCMYGIVQFLTVLILLCMWS